MELIDKNNTCMKIFEYYEYRTDIETSRIFYKIIKEFEEHFNIKIDFSNVNNRYLYGKYLSYGLHLIELFWVDYRYNGYLFYLLDKYKFNLYELMYEVIRNIGYNINFLNQKSYIKNLISLPFIDDIVIDGKSKYTIYSSKLGNFSFELFGDRYKYSNSLRKYLKCNGIINCHENALMLAQEFPDFNLITSLCSSYFGGTFYHSYTKDQNKIIDLCTKTVMDVEVFNLLNNPIEIINIPNRSVEGRAIVAKYNTQLPDNWLSPLKIALYEQFLELQENEEELNKILAYDIKKDKE